MRQLKTKYVRMKKKSKEETPVLKPHMEWQTGEYARLAEIRFALPYQFLLLCRLTDVTPYKVITDFAEALDGGNSLHPVSDDCKEHIVDYFISRGYGQQHYSPELHRIFKEMQGCGCCFPKPAEPKWWNCMLPGAKNTSHGGLINGFIKAGETLLMKYIGSNP